MTADADLTDASALLAVRALGVSSIRVRILAVAAREKQVSSEQLRAELGIPASTLSVNMRPLVEAGILIPEPAPSQRGRKGGVNRLVWNLDEAALRRMLHELQHVVVGS